MVCVPMIESMGYSERAYSGENVQFDTAKRPEIGQDLRGAADEMQSGPGSGSDDIAGAKPEIPPRKLVRYPDDAVERITERLRAGAFAANRSPDRKRHLG